MVGDELINGDRLFGGVLREEESCGGSSQGEAAERYGSFTHI